MTPEESHQRITELAQELAQVKAHNTLLRAATEALNRYYLQTDDEPWPTVEEALTAAREGGAII